MQRNSNTTVSQTITRFAQVNAEFIDDLLTSEIKPTAILMNPPFSATVTFQS